MRKTVVAVMALVLIVGACGDDDTGSGSETSTAETSAPSADSTEAPAATSAPSSTTTAAAALSGPEAFIAASAERLGEYEGQWDNTTFGSTGALHIEVVEANPGTINNVLIQVDVDGFAFGGDDPEGFAAEIWVEGGELVIGFTGLLTDGEFDIADDGSFTMSASPRPLEGMTLEVEGTIDGDGFGGTYTIPGLADGTWSAARAG